MIDTPDENEDELMTVNRLRSLLDKYADEFDGEDPVVIQSSITGNAANAFMTWRGAYADGRVGLIELDHEDRNCGFTEEDVVDGKPSLVIQPC